MARKKINQYQKYLRKYKVKIKPYADKTKKQTQLILQKLKPLLFFFNTYKITLVLVLILIFFAQKLFISSNQAEKSKRNLIAYPWLAINHINMAQDYYNFGYLDEAENALQNIDKSLFLQWQIKLISQWQNKYQKTKTEVNHKKVIESEIAKWEEFLQDNPASVPIYLKLSLLYWQIKDESKAQEYLKKASYLDPVSIEVKKIQELFNKQD